MTGTGEKVRAVFLALIMITSVMAAGMALSGSAAAANGISGTDVNTDGETHANIGQTTAQGVEIDFTVDGITADNNDDVITVNLGQDNLDITNVGTATVTGDSGETVGTAELDPGGDGTHNEAIELTVTDDGSYGGSLTVDLDLTVDATDASEATNDVTVDVTDNSGNSNIAGATVGSLTVDGTAPTVDTIETLDTNDNGDIDTANIIMDEAVDDSTLTNSHFEIGDTDVDSFSTNTVDDEGNPVDQDADDDRFSVSITTTADEADGTDEVQVHYDGSSLTDLAGNQLGTVDDGTVSETDLAAPQVDSVDVTDQSEVTVTFSEGVQDEGSSGEALDSSDFNYIDDGNGGATDIGGAGVNHNGLSDNTAVIQTDNALTSTDISGSADAIESLSNIADDQDIQLDSGNNVETDITSSSGPTMISAETSSVDSNGNVNEITVQFSTSLSDSDSTLTSDAFSLSVGTVSGVDTGNSGDDDTLVLSVSNLQGNSVTPEVTMETGDGGVTISDGSNSRTTDQTIQSTNGVSSTLQGDANSDISTGIGGSGSQALSAGSGAQTLDLIKIRDVSGGNSPLAQRTILTMPDGVTINETESDLLVTATSGDLSVTSTEIVDENTLRIEHSGSSEGGQTLRVSGLAVDVANDVDASYSGVVSDINVDYATGNLDTGLVTAHTPRVYLNGQIDVGAGSTGAPVDQDVVVSAPSASNGDLSGIIANQSEIVIYANESNGVTWDASVDPSSLSYTDSGNNVNTSAVSISENQITVPVTSDFSGGDSFQIDGDNSLKINVSTTASSSLLNADTEATTSTGVVAAEQTSTSQNIKVKKPQLTFDGSGETLAVGEEGKQLSSTSADVIVDSQTQGDLVTGDGSATDQTGWLNFTINRSDVTFDTSIDDGNADPIDVAATGSGEIRVDGGNEGNIVATNTTLSVPVESTGMMDASEQVSVQNIPLNVSDSAPEDGKFNFNVTTTPAPDKVIPVTATNNGDPSSDPAPATLDKPNLQEASGTIAIGATGQGFSGQQLQVTSTVDGDLTTGTDSDDSTGWINVTTNRSDVTFDKSADYSSNNLVSSTSGNLVDAGDDGTTGTPDFTDDVVVTDDKLAVNVELNGGPGGAGLTFADNGIQLNTSNTIEDGSDVVLNVTTTPEDGKEVAKGATSNTITLNNPDARLPGGDQTTYLDNDGQTGVSLDNLKVDSQVSGDLTTGGDGNGTTGWVNATLNGTGVTFDTSVTKGTIVTASDGDIQIEGGNADNIAVTEDKLAVPVELTASADGNEYVTLGGAQFNVSQDVADNTTYGLTVTTTPEADTEVSQDLSETITVQTVVPDDISITDSTTNPSVLDGSDTTVTVKSSSLSSTDTSDNFGSADVELSLLSQPDNANYTIDDVVNETTLTTASDGTAVYNFSASVTGDYVIDHNASGEVNTTETYTVSSGDVNAVDVTGAENALRGGASGLNDNLRTGVYQVNVTDAQGNLASTNENFEFRVLVSGDTSAFIGLSNELTDDGQGGSAATSVTQGFAGTNAPFTNAGTSNNVIQYNPSNDGVEQGTFYVYVGNDLAEDIDVQIIPRSSFSDIDPDTGTTTFYGGTNSVNLSVDETLTEGDNATATATAITSSGEVIEVPRIGETFSSDNSSIISVGDTTATDLNGEATANISADGAGTANLTATLRSTDATTEITVEGVDYEITDVSLEPDTVTGNQTVDHDLSYTVTGASNDGNSDTYTITLPNTTSFAGSAPNSLNVTDANGDEISISDSASLADANGGTDNQLTFGIQPDSAFDTRAVNVDANVTVDFPAVEETTEGDVTLDVSDSNEGDTNATTTVTIEPAAQANLSTSYDVDATTVETGENVTITATVENTGDASGSTTVEFYADGSELSNTSVTVDAGNSTTVSETTSFSEAGTHNVTVNDLEATNITVEEPAMANFMLSELDAPDEITQNESYTVTATVTNDGDADGEQDVAYELLDADDNTSVSLSETVSLNASENTSVSFDVTSDQTDLAAGNYTHVVSSDDDEVSQNATIVEPVDLGTLDVSVEPQTVTANETTDVTVTVTDNATGDAVEGATVEISDLLETETTDANGTATFTVNESIAGDYPIDVSADGYEDADATLTITEDDGPSLDDYTNEDGSTTTSLLRNAINDWRNNDIDTDLLREVIGNWRAGR
jgi:surface glycoprotein (TIGR04207 family)